MSLYEFVDELGRVIRSGRLRAVGGTVGDVPTQQADHSLSQSPGGGSQPVLTSKDVLFTEQADASPLLPITGVGLNVIYLITAVDQAAKTFSVAGDRRTETALWIATGNSGLVVSGSTGNDGFYTPLLVAYDGSDTTITVSEAISDATVDGALGFNSGTLTFDGDQRDRLLPTELLIISGSSGNDGYYYVCARPTFAAGTTTVLIGANVTLSDPTADGDAQPASYRYSIPLPAGSVVDTVRFFPLAAPWAADVFAGVFVYDDLYSYTPSGIDLHAASNMALPYDPLNPLATGGSGKVNYATLATAETQFINSNYKGGVAEFVKGGFPVTLAESWPGPGVRYAEAATLRLAVFVAQTAPVVPTGQLLCKILYWPGATPADATFG